MDANLIARYRSTEGAAAYRRKYERSWVRRLSNWREMRLVARALRLAGTSGRVLDCPCGAGRLVPTLLSVADHVTAVDMSDAMVAEARDALQAEVSADRVAFAVAGANDLPFDDGAFDTAVCHRLIHHMGDADERAGVFRELARVARRRVVLSFSDDSTWKGRSQRRREIKRSRYALMPEQLAEEMGAHGWTPVGSPMHINPVSSLVAVAVFAKAL